MKATVKDALIESAAMRQRAKSATENHAEHSPEGTASDIIQRMATQPIRVTVYRTASHITEHKKYPTKQNTAAQAPGPPTPAEPLIPHRTVRLTQSPAYRPSGASQTGFFEPGRSLFKGTVAQRRSAARSLQQSWLVIESLNAGSQSQPAPGGAAHDKAAAVYPTSGRMRTPSVAQKAAMTNASRNRYPTPASAAKKDITAKPNASKKKAPSTKERQRNLNKTADKAWVQQQAKERGKKKAQNEAAKKAKKAASKGVRSVTTATRTTVGAVRNILQLPGRAFSAVLRPLLLVCMIFTIFSVGSIIFVLGSSFGIFAAGDGGLREVVSEINAEYERQLKAIWNKQEYDQLDMSGAQSDWRTVLSIYAVLVTTNAENPGEVISMDDVKEDLLREIFWQMNSISWELGTIEIPNPDCLPSEDESAAQTSSISFQKYSGPQIVPLVKIPLQPVPEPEETTPPTIPPTIEQTVLYITISHQTASQMARHYNFTNEQMTQLEELLLPANARLWNDVIYGISTGGNGEIVAVAASQIGNYNGNPYWTWGGFSQRVGWCAIFISWCGNECGYIEAGILPKTASPINLRDFFRDQNRWCGNSYTPSPGDIIFIDYPDRGKPGSCDHVGIVEYVDDGIAHTIEGNVNNSVERRQRVLGDPIIMGYGVLNPDVMTTEKEGESIDTTPVRNTEAGTVQQSAVLFHPAEHRRAAAAHKRQRRYWKIYAV